MQSPEHCHTLNYNKLLLTVASVTYKAHVIRHLNG